MRETELGNERRLRDREGDRVRKRKEIEVIVRETELGNEKRLR